MFGWKGDSLQKAMDKSECFYDGCGSLKKQQMSVANKCTVKDSIGEQTDGCTCAPCFHPKLSFSYAMNANLLF